MGLHAHRPFRPRGKEAAAAASFPLGEGLGWSKLQPRLIYARVVVSVYTQIDTSCSGQCKIIKVSRCLLGGVLDTYVTIV